MRLLWERMTPFGLPEVPELKHIAAGTFELSLPVKSYGAVGLRVSDTKSLGNFGRISNLVSRMKYGFSVPLPYLG